ncbi:MAG TPA: cytochrome c [Burkholderiaceae bacterium]|nr:cytochrome c [Burkholderiaceae bacterium]
MNKWPRRIMLLAALVGTSTMAHSQAPPSQSRGQLLYGTHCISCHASQMQVRNDKRAHDWDGLKGQVRRCQGNADLQWSDADIAEVARHLNETIYRYPQTGDRVSIRQKGNAMVRP